MRSFYILSVVFFLSSCSNVNQPRTPQQKGLDRGAFDFLSSPSEDFESTEINLTEEIEDDEDPESSIDERFYKKISISVTDQMHMREALSQMAELAGINIFIANNIEGNLSFSAKNRPFLDILQDVCESTNLKYIISGNSVKIEQDSPMMRVYKVPVLNIQRDTQSSVNVSTDVFNESILSSNSTNDEQSKNSLNNGSNSVISGITKNDFWTELESSIKTIVGNTENNNISIHKQSGLVTVYATQKKHKEIQKYIKLLKEASESQVLIEAKILEINLNDEFKSGINWNFAKFSGGFTKAYDTSGLFTATLQGTSQQESSNNWKIASGFIEKFGAVKTLSSPRITILNNHSAILKVAKNEVIYLPSFQKQYNGKNSDNITDVLSTNMKSIPIGLIMSVQPAIDTKANSIMLTIRPTISRIVEKKQIPFLFNNYKAGSTSSQHTTQMQDVPIVDVREMDSVLKLQSGQVIVIGGLMSEQSTNARDGLPGLQDTPVDILTSERNRQTSVTELVIFLRATIVRNKNHVYHKADEKIYNKFASDPRKLKLKK